MKYSLLVVALLTLTPCLVYAQNQQFSDCRTLEMAGKFIGADEALVDGLVCRVGKPKTSVPASRPAAAKAAEGSKALLGIIRRAVKPRPSGRGYKAPLTSLKS
jgi:enoyl-CoA hydratase/carnithine racemase